MSGEARAIGSSTKSQSGVSMVEVLVVLAVVGILASIALPSYSKQFARSRLRATAEQIRSDVNLARSESLKRNVPIVMSFTVNADSSWCYGLTLLANCSCTVTDVANASYCFLDRDASNAVISSTVSSTNYRDITLPSTPFGDGNITFQPVRPVLESTSVTLASAKADASMRVIASGLGRVRFCSPNASLSGYPSC